MGPEPARDFNVVPNQAGLTQEVNQRAEKNKQTKKRL
jgi:hypothetical protein